MLQDRRLSITILTIAGALAMIVSACGPMVYGGVKPEQLARIQKGKTTKTDLLRELGAPDQQIDLGGGREEVSYIEEKYTRSVVGQAKSDNTETWFTVKKGVVEDFGTRPTTKSHKYGGGM